MTHYRYNGHNRVCECSNDCEYKGGKIEFEIGPSRVGSHSGWGVSWIRPSKQKANFIYFIRSIINVI